MRDRAAAKLIASKLARMTSFFIPPTFDWNDRVTGRKGWQPSFELIAFGMYVKRARHLIGMSQTKLETLSGADQGQISRLERALSPTTRVERLVALSGAMGRALPLGFCPHEHWCEWQPAQKPSPEKTWQEKWAEAESHIDRSENVDERSDRT